MRSIADVSRGVIRAVVEIDAPPAEVFAALTEPAQLASWWGGDVYRTRDWRLDLRPGGSWSVRAEGPRGTTEVRGEVLEIDPPHALTLTWEASWDGFTRTTLRYRLDAVASGTRLSVVHDGFAGRPEQCENHAQGWNLVLGWLAEHAERR